MKYHRIHLVILQLMTKHPLCLQVNASDAVLYTAREKEKPYLPDQEDQAVVQPYAAYGPPGNPKVNLFTVSTLTTVAQTPVCPPL